MNDVKLLPKPAVALAYGEPWRGRHGAIVCDQHGVHGGHNEMVDRAYYGGTLIAESVNRRLAERAAQCVNFCAGVEFEPDFAYVGGLVDLLDSLATLHERTREPDLPSLDPEERDHYRLWSTVNQLLRHFGRDSWSRRKAQEARSA
jgi:hypothetical protein